MPPGMKKMVAYNLCQLSDQECMIFGSERPGYIYPSRTRPVTPRGILTPLYKILSMNIKILLGPDTTRTVVHEWIDAMKNNNIKRVLCLLNEEELGFYAEPLLPTLRKHFTTVLYDINMNGTTILKNLQDAIAAQEKIVLFCSTVKSKEIQIQFRNSKLVQKFENIN